MSGVMTIGMTGRLPDAPPEDMGMRIGAIEVHLGLMDGKLKTMDGQLQTMDGKLKTMDGQLKTMDGKLQTMDGHIKQLDVRMTHVEDRLSKVETRLTTVDERLTGVEIRLTTLETKWDAVVPTLATKADLFTLTAVVHKMDASIKTWLISAMIGVAGFVLAVSHIQQTSKPLASNTPSTTSAQADIPALAER